MLDQLITPIVCGGLNETLPANDYIQDLLNNVIFKILSKAKLKFKII